MSSNPTPAPSTAPTPTSTSHPLLHEDIFPLILDQCSDVALARLMRVSRGMLEDIVDRRWPVITINLTGFHRPDPSRTSLPVQATDFSPTMTILLSRYAKKVRINPHRVAPCPPDLVWAGEVSRTRTLLVDRKGLCQSHDPAYPSWELPACEICSLFQPTTLRIDRFVSREQGPRSDLRYYWGPSGPPPSILPQNPILPIPSALSFAPTLTRLVLFTSLDNPGANLLDSYSMDYLHRALPAHIVDVVFVLVMYKAGLVGEKVSSNIGVHLAPWLAEG